MPMAEKVGPFRIISQIAKGGMGRVYLAEHAEKGRHVAVKVLPEKFLTDRKRSQYLERELKIAQKLRHSNVVDIYGLHKENGIGYLIMEYLDGGNLRRHIKSRELNLSETLEVILKICEGLHYIHNHKLEDGRFHSIIHMDIKPENILLSKNGRLKLADFGLSLSEDFWMLRKLKKRAGTPFYMSPEQIRGKNLDIRTDIYSLGLVIYELLTGQLPYKGQDREMYMKMVISRKTRPAPPSYLNPDIPRQFDAITMKALAKKTDARYQTVAEMIMDLQRLGPTLMQDDFTEEFRFMRSVKLNNAEAKTTEVPAGEVNVGAVKYGAEQPLEKKEEPAESFDSRESDSEYEESGESVDMKPEADFDDEKELKQDLLQRHREFIYAEDPGKAGTIKTAESKEPERMAETPVETDIKEPPEKEIEKAGVAKANDAQDGKPDEPVGEFLPAAEDENEAVSEEPEDTAPVPAALGENSGLVDGELLEETALSASQESPMPDRPVEVEEARAVAEAAVVTDDNGTTKDVEPEAVQAGEEFGSDGFSSLDVDEIENFIFIGREKG